MPTEARVTQEVAEEAVSEIDNAARVTQTIAEEGVAGVDNSARVTQVFAEIAVEVVVQPEAPPTEPPSTPAPPLPAPQAEPTPFPAGEYRVVVADLLGNPIEEIPAQNVQFSYILNAPGSVSFSLKTLEEKNTPSLMDPGKRVIYVYRAGFLAWGGYLWSANPTMELTQFGGEGWFSRLRRRYISDTQTFTGVDQFQIARTILNYTQSKTDGDLGIVNYSMSDTSGVLRTETISGAEFKNVGEFLEQLAARENGFDFDITPDRKWRTYYPRKGQRTNHVFELGKNISGISYQHDAAKTATEITAIGDAITSTAIDTTQRARYGLLQDTVSFGDVSLSGTLAEHAEEELRVRKVARLQPELSLSTNDPMFGTYSVGDEVRVRADWGYIQLDDYFRIITIVVAISNEGREAITVFFDPSLAGETV